MRISQTILMRLEQLGRQVDAMQQHLFNTTVRLQDETNDDVVLTPVKDIDQFLSLEGRLAADGNIKLKLVRHSLYFSIIFFSSHCIKLLF